MESKLLDSSLNDLSNVAAKLRIAELPEELSKMAILRLIRAEIEKHVDEGANMKFLETLMKSLVGDPPPLEDSLEEPNSEGDSEEAMERRREELEKGRAIVEQMKKEYEAMEKLLREKEVKFKEAKDSLKKMSINISQNQSQVSVNPNQGKPPVDQSLQALGNILRIKDFKISWNISNDKGHISLSNLNKQIESGLAKGYSERDILDGVIQAISSALHL